MGEVTTAHERSREAKQGNRAGERALTSMNGFLFSWGRPLVNSEKGELRTAGNQTLS